MKLKKYDQFINENVSNMLILDEVGTAMDLTTGMCYPINSDDTIDYESGTEIDQCENDEWWELLSKENAEKILSLFGDKLQPHEIKILNNK